MVILVEKHHFLLHVNTLWIEVNMFYLNEYCVQTLIFQIFGFRDTIKIRNIKAGSVTEHSDVNRKSRDQFADRRHFSPYCYKECILHSKNLLFSKCINASIIVVEYIVLFPKLASLNFSERFSRHSFKVKSVLRGHSIF